MKRGQLLSQPFFYILAIVVIGLTFFFGYYIISRVLGTACQVENKQFVYDLNGEINKIYDAGFTGSSEKCSIVNSVGQSDLKCKLIVPSGSDSVCIVDPTASLDYSGVNVKDIREELEALQGGRDSNLFFHSINKDCEMNSVKIKNLEIQEPICFSGKRVDILLENTGRSVEVTKV